MLFNSYTFLLFFLPITLALYHSLPGSRSRLVFLACASWLFYAWWSLPYALMTLAFCAVNYSLAGFIHALESQARKRSWLVIVVTLDLGVLLFFKYYGFLASASHSFRLSLPHLDLALPIGISFYTFQGISYAVDLYRREIQPAPDLLRFTSFKLFFPQLIAGPIVRFGQIGNQLGSLRTDYGLFSKGIFFFVNGLLRKVVLADTMARIANEAFGGGYAGLGAYLGVVAYTFQIYFDFSAYSDMACGLGLMFGIELPRNFNSPYKSKSLSEFWKRWHITLSRWLRDYLYIPLGGNRQGRGRMYLALVLTMLLGGLWHGANYTFLVWGLFHGLLLCLEKALGARNPLLRLPSWAQVAVTFHLVMVGWIFFRCPSLGTAIGYFAGLFRWSGWIPAGLESRDLLEILICGALIWSLPNLHERPFRLAWPQISWSLAGLVLGIAVLLGRQSTPFLYFQF